MDYYGRLLKNGPAFFNAKTYPVLGVDLVIIGVLMIHNGKELWSVHKVATTLGVSPSAVVALTEKESSLGKLDSFSRRGKLYIEPKDLQCWLQRRAEWVGFLVRDEDELEQLADKVPTKEVVA